MAKVIIRPHALEEYRRLVRRELDVTVKRADRGAKGVSTAQKAKLQDAALELDLQVIDGLVSKKVPIRFSRKTTRLIESLLEAKQSRILTHVLPELVRRQATRGNYQEAINKAEEQTKELEKLLAEIRRML